MDIDKIFQDYSQKKKEQKIARDQEWDIQAKATDAGLKIIESSVVPVLEDIAEQIVAKGYKAEIKKSLEGSVHPRIELKFYPVPPDSVPHSHISPSKIEFRCQEKDRLKVTREINTQSGRVSSYISGPRELTAAHEDASQDWVRKTTLEFIQAVLSSN